MTTTIKSITSKEFTNEKSGKTTVSYTVELANGVSGYLNTQGSSAELKQGEQVEYNLDVKKNKKGGDYNLLTLNRVFPSQQQVTGAPVSAPETRFVAPPSAKIDIIKMKFDSRMQLCELTHKLILEGNLSDSEAKLHLVAWCTEMDNLIDGIFA